MSKLFNEPDGILSDQCAIDARNRQNAGINNYNIFNFYKGTADDCTKYSKKDIIDLSLDTQMHLKDGYGVTDRCVVDEDSKLRNGQVWTNPKEKVQLYARVFQGIPNINTGGLNVPVEDIVKQGQYNYLRKGCDNQSEQQYDSFMPLVPCLAKTVQTDRTVIPPWEGHGIPIGSRDYIQQSRFLESNGYVLDGKVWRRKICRFN